MVQLDSYYENKMMHKMKAIVVFLTLLILYGCQESRNTIAKQAFSNFLEYGQYKVGFKTLFVSDVSRPAVPYADWSGKLYPEDEITEARNLPIHIWYPTNTITELLPYRHFVNLIARKAQNEVSQKKDSLAEHIFAYQTNELGRKTDLTDKEMEILLQLGTGSSLNAEPIQQKFPLIVFPNGSSPANQSVMCEYWASHGYIVAAISLKGQFSSVIDASVKGLEVAVDDLEFALQKLFELPNVDGNQVALVANAIESSFCAGLASRNEKIKALVSLEGGFLSRYEQDILSKTSFYDPQNLSLPILAIYAPHPNISPGYIDDLKYSERYFAHFPGMSEFHFLNYGVFEAYVPNIIGKPKGEVRKGFKVASEITLWFLNAKLKSQAEQLTGLYTNGIPERYKPTVDSLFKKQGFDPPPNMAQLKNIFVSKGMDGIDSVYQSQLAQGDRKPFSMSFYNDFRNWLAWKKDPEYKNRLKLYQFAVESYPNLAENNYRLAYYLKLNGQEETAMAYYEQTKKILPLDSTLTREQKKRIEHYMAEDLQ